MSIRLTNTLTRKKEELQPIHDKDVRIYSCGPTVYWFAHIGNLRGYIVWDVLRRLLEDRGYTVQHVMNITDVGHLTGDTDDGEDKMLVAMRREGKSAWDIAAFYTEAFLQDFDRLGIKRPHILSKATDHIPEQIVLVEELEKKGLTYRTSDGIYFDTSKLPEYGRLSGQKLEDKKGGARIEVGEKKQATDFALWKFSPAGEKREMEWESPWGVGFPGWHLECSAMAKKYLGVPFDIHTGGVDHIAVHHENELAQTFGADGVLEANVWLHNEFLTVQGGRMGKSLGNLYTIQDLLDRGFDPLAYRLFVLQSHYRTKVDFSFEALGAAQNALTRLRRIIRDWDKPAVGCAEYEQRFFDALEDDVGTPQALAVLWELVGDEQQPTSARAQSILHFDAVLGLGLDAYVSKPEEIPEAAIKLAHEREEARQQKDWTRADELRTELSHQGFIVEDTPDGPRVSRA